MAASQSVTVYWRGN